VNNDDDKTELIEEAYSPSPALQTQSWKDQDILLKKMWFQGATQQEIAETLNRSPQAVMTRAARLGLPRRMASGRKVGGKNVQHKPYTKRGTSDTGTQKYIERICLMCLKKFGSVGKFNRICSDCKESRDYRIAASLSEVQIISS